MAASGRHVGHYIQRNGRFLRVNLERLWLNRYEEWTYEYFMFLFLNPHAYLNVFLSGAADRNVFA